MSPKKLSDYEANGVALLLSPPGLNAATRAGVKRHHP
jgi:hypothetical protein